MGLSIHYSGSFNTKASLQAMIEEVKDIAEIYKWRYYVFEDQFPADSPGKAEYNQIFMEYVLHRRNVKPFGCVFFQTENEQPF